MSDIGPIPPGRYRHYKGNEYTVVGMARHSESLEAMVVYRPEYGERGLWVRPAKMFTETVTVGGESVARFQPLGPSSAAAVPVCRDNLLANLPSSLPSELVQTLLTAEGIRIERIISRGQASPEGFWYDQPHHEWVVVLIGEAKLQFEGQETIAMKVGDCVNIPAHVRHRVEWTPPDKPTVWLAVHYESGADRP